LAARIRGGVLPQWTDGVFAFPAVNLSFIPNGPDVVGLGVNTYAYSAYVDCRVLTDYQVTRLDAGADGATITFSAVDRGCDITVRGGVSGSSTTYLKTTAKTNCPSNTGYSRLAMFAGMYDSTAPNLLFSESFISCMPFYRKTPGLLEIESAVSSTPALVFTPNSNQTSDFRFDTWASFEEDVQNVQQINSASPDFTSSLGELFLQYSRHVSTEDWIEGENLADSVSVIFTSVFAVLATTTALQPASDPTMVAATLNSSENRLHVVPWIAYSFFAIFAILIIQTVLTQVHVQRHRTFLLEEPKGLLSNAEIVTNSSALQQFVRQAQADPAYQGKICEYVEGKYDLEKTRCWVTRQAGQNAVLLGAIEAGAPKPKKAWRRLPRKRTS
jgi:hypothetical protein